MSQKEEPPMTDAVTRAIEILNDALERDPAAMTRLINLRVPCNDRLAAHPTIAAGLYDDVHKVGVLGLLNGVLGDAPHAVIGAKGRRDSKTGGLRRVRRFVDLRPHITDVRA